MNPLCASAVHFFSCPFLRLFRGTLSRVKVCWETDGKSAGCRGRIVISGQLAAYDPEHGDSERCRSVPVTGYRYETRRLNGSTLQRPTDREISMPWGCGSSVCEVHSSEATSLENCRPRARNLSPRPPGHKAPMVSSRLQPASHDRSMTTDSNGARPYPKVSTLGSYQGWPRPCELLTVLP